MSSTFTWDDSITGAKLDAAIESGLRHAATVIRDESVERTPEDTGALRDSAGIDVGGREASVYYDEYYAPFVHEKLNNHHRRGQAKFLESALQSEADRALDAMASEMSRVLSDG